MANYHPILMKIDTHKEKYAQFKTRKSGSVWQKTAKIISEKRYRFKKATLYEHAVVKKQKVFIRWQKLP
jgi:hypothetical protein